MSSIFEIKVPPLGESISEATIAKWVKKIGDHIATDDLIVEIETDKVTMEINSQVTGTLKSIEHPEGAVVKIDDLLGIIDIAVINNLTSNSDNNNEQKQSADAAVIADLSPLQMADNTPGNKESMHLFDHIKKLSPAVEKITAQGNININAIQGSGKDNRIVKADIINQQEDSKILPEENNSNINDVNNQSEQSENRVKMTSLRKTISSHLKDAQNTAAMLTTFNEINMANVILCRKKYQDNFIKKYNVKLGFMSFFVKACCLALKDIPIINTSIENDEIIYKNYCNIGVAIASPKGLFVPVLKNAEKLSFAAIEQKIIEYADKAKNNKLTMSHLQGGSFTITNGGTFGSLISTPIINIPEAAILGMHKIQERPVVVNGEITICPMMYVALTYDHRIIDGKEAVTFLVKVKEYLENIERMAIII